jgi:uncharacterized glyoxalase superfamily protein PhnB
MNGVKSGKSSVIPSLRYRDAPAAIEWLCRNFGFEQQLVVPDDKGGVAHAQLRLGGGMIMLGSVDTNSDTDFGKTIRQPDEVGGFETQCPYLVVEDADQVWRNVKANGGQITMEIKDEDYGGRGFGCRDIEGRQWYVGTYDPWA